MTITFYTEKSIERRECKDWCEIPQWIQPHKPNILNDLYKIILSLFMNAFNCPDYIRAEGKAFPVHVMQAYEGVKVHLHSFLN